ncbi:hypothetical protein C8J57DRAFT_1711272 [Mycena rebaudengoi]|nr:hypothetical protein C8J57DRAFT_1711272 [Mycena rebaudengoi]
MNPLQDQYSPATIQLVADQQLSLTFSLLGLVIPCYDHILTLSDEIRYIWWLITTVNPPSLLSIDDQVYGPGGSDLIIPQCTDFVDPESAKRVAGAWLIQLGLDLLIFGLTLLRGFKLMHKSEANNPLSLIHCLVRDGAIYFAVILSLNIMNILMLLFGRPLFAASLSWMTASIPSAMVSRLMLNLHQVADAGIHRTTYDVDSEVRFRSPPIELDVLDLHRTTDEELAYEV